MENSTVQMGSTVAQPVAAQQAGPCRRWHQSASAPRRRARGAWDGELAAGSPAAKVHRRDYAER
jgi:hypothetical protein